MLGHAQELPSQTGSFARTAEHRRAILLVLLFLTLSLVGGWWSDGVYHEDDLTHYLFARWSHSDPRYLVDWWGRPGFTAPYSWPAAIGSTATGLQVSRVFSAVLSTATAWLVYCIARQIGIRRAWTAIPLLFLQPLFARLSLTTLTETPLAFYFALSSWLLLKGRLEWSAIIMALGPVTRDESVVLLPLWAIAMWLRGGRWWLFLLLGWAIVAHNLASAVALGAFPFVRWLRPDGVDHYGQGTLLTFVPKLAYACGPVIVALAVLGIRRTWRAPLGWLWVLAPASYFAGETFIYLRGAYSSGGYSRFLVPIAPWIAVLAAAGVQGLLIRKLTVRVAAGTALVLAGLFALCEIEWLWRNPVSQPELQTWAHAGRVALALLCIVLAVCGMQLRRPEGRPTWATATVTTVLIGFLGAGLAGFLPLRLNRHQACLREYTPMLSMLLQQERPVLTLNRWLYFWTDKPVSWTHSQDLPRLIRHARPGTILVWDSRFCCDPEPPLDYVRLESDPGWRLIWRSDRQETPAQPEVACFERQSGIQMARPGAQSSP